MSTTLFPKLLNIAKDPTQGTFIHRVESTRKFFVNAVKFKIYNFRTKGNELRLNHRIKLNVHEKAYYAFRYFTDFDNEMVEEFESFLELTKLCHCFIDVGAHYGIFSLSFSQRPDSTAYALEPSPTAFEILEHHVTANPSSSVRAYSIAASSSDRNINMVPDSSDHLIVSEQGNLGVSIDAITLDDFVLNQKISPDVIKIDVEGYELDVLKGAKQILVDLSPLIFLEIHPDALVKNGASVEEVISLLNDLGYKFFGSRGGKIDKGALSKLTKIIRVVCRK